MKAKHVFLAVAALIAAGGLWLVAFHKPSMGEMPRGQADPVSIRNDSRLVTGSKAGPENANTTSPKPGQVLNRPARLAPPSPNRRFTDFTPEQRVEFARKGHGPGG